MKVRDIDHVFNKIKEVLIKNKLIILTVVIVGLITHFYLYSHNVTSPDGLYQGTYHMSGKWEDTLGRWALKGFDIVRGGIVNDFLIVCIGLTFLSISTIVLVKVFEIKNNNVIILLSAIIATAPQFAETFMYQYCADAYCFAMLTSVLSIYFMRKKNNILNNIIAIIMIIITCSIYQCYIGVTIGLSIILLIFDILQMKNNKDAIKSGIKYVVIEILGIILYYAVTILILKIKRLSLASYGGANEVGIKNFQNIHVHIYNTYKTFFEYFFTDKILYNTYWKRNIVNIILALTSITTIFTIIIKNKLYRNKVSMILLLVLIAILPIGINIIEIVAPARKINLIMATSLLTMYVFSLKLYELLKTNSVEKIQKYFISISMISIIFTCILSNNASYMAREDVYNNYYATSINILNKVESLEGYNAKMKFMFNDVIRYRSPMAKYGNGFISNTYETWADFSGMHTNKQFYKRYFGRDIQICNKEEYDRIVKSDEYKSMNNYPNENSIKIIDNVIVIKLNNNVFK